MWSSVSFTQFIPDTNLNHYLPSFYSSASSTFTAAAVGGMYGLVGRVMYPNAGISPLHYAVWFVLAFQIKHFVFSMENRFDRFLCGKVCLQKLEEVSEDESNLEDLVRYHCWEVIQLKDGTLHIIDDFFCKMVNIRPSQEVTADNVEEASFIEMCRYRIWPVFKTTILDTVSFAIAYRFANHMGFTISNYSAVPILIVIRSIVKDIILIPALYVYIRMCNQIADHLRKDQTDAFSNHRATWIRWCLPSL